MTRSAADRRRALARILREGPVATQERMLAALGREGFQATQATLSRDLARLGARRVSRPEGSYYELGEEAPGDAAVAVAGLVASVACNGGLVVVRTAPGSASAVARAVDLARVEGVLGTIAGDDTIFVAPSSERGGPALAARLARLLGQPAAPAARQLAATRSHSRRERATQSSMARPSK